MFAERTTNELEPLIVRPTSTALGGSWSGYIIVGNVSDELGRETIPARVNSAIIGAPGSSKPQLKLQYPPATSRTVSRANNLAANENA